jgi:hypothetical protein
MISIHQIEHLYAKQSELGGGNWVEVYFQSKIGEQCSIVFYFDSTDLASVFHDTINNLPTQHNLDALAAAQDIEPIDGKPTQ